MLGSSLHDNFSNCSVSSIENVVKSLLQKLCGFVNAAINYNIQVLKRKTDINTYTAKLTRLCNMSSFFTRNK